MSALPTPRPLGRDRVEAGADGLALLSLHAKPWAPREEARPGSLARAGTAVRWDGAIYEVLRVERREAGGFRHVLAPWDERQLIRSIVDYEGDEVAPDEGAPADAGTPGVPAAAGSATWWPRLPDPVRALAPAFVVAVFFGWFFPIRVMGEGISFFVHELGHTVTAWFFGCSALPAIVMTIAFEQVLAAAVLIWGGICYAAYRWRRAPRWNVALAATAVIYPLLAFTKAHVLLFDLGGHLAELAFAAWALHRVLRGGRPEWERPVWAFFAFYLVARNVKLFAGVALSAAARTDYLTIAITDRNDLVKAAEKTGLSLEALAALTAIAFVAVPLAVLVLALRRPASARPARV